MSIAELKFKKELVKGEPKLRLESFTGVNARDELPVEYINGFPRFYADGIRIHVYANDKQHISILMHDVYDPKNIWNIVKVMKVAGSRLTAINKNIKAKHKNWRGDKVIKI